MNDTNTLLGLVKAPTGIAGLDEITFGGLPAGRPTLIAGAAGCGKTLFALTFLVKGATDYGEPGAFISFEERAGDLAANVDSLGYDLPGLLAAGRLAIDHIHVDREQLEQAGDFDLEGLFVRIGHAIDTVGAKRVVLDTMEALFTGFSDAAVLRGELVRLFAWLKDRGVTALITAERGREGQLTRHGLEEYVSDCVIALDNRVEDQITTRRLRVLKYRGSAHGTNEYPFLIDTAGISVLPITSAGLGHATSDEVVSSGVAGIDAMLAVGGFYRGSSILVSGTAGTGKSVFGAHFVNAACRRGERALLFSFEESPDQIVRNMRSVGIDLTTHVDAGLLRIESARPSLFGLEMHLVLMVREVERFAPQAVVIDPISAFRGTSTEIYATLLRMVDVLKGRGITALFSNLIQEGEGEATQSQVSSLMDSWIGLQNVEANGERNRALYLFKSRGMSHSNQIREYRLTDDGIELVEVYVGAAGVLTGTARVAQEERERAEAVARRRDRERRGRELDARRASTERQIGELRAALEADIAEFETASAQENEGERVLDAARDSMAAARGGAS